MNILKRLYYAARNKDDNQATVVSDVETYGWGADAEITMDTLVKYRNTDMKFRLAVTFGMSYSVGIGFHNTADSTPQGKKILEKIDDFCDEVDLDTINQAIAMDVWATGNAFLRPMEANQEMRSVQMVPVSSIIRIKRDADGTVDEYLQSWGSKLKQLEGAELLHFKWMAENASAWGTGIGQALAHRGVGYRTSSGKLVRRPSMFQISEMMTDVQAKMVYSGLPRYDVYANVKDDNLAAISKSYDKSEPLQHFLHNYESEVKSVSLDTQNRFDSFLRALDDTFLNGVMTPIPRMFSSLNFTYASAETSIDSYLPLVRMYQRAHKRFIENHIYKPILMEEYDAKAIKKSQISLNWGQQDEIDFEEIKQVHEMLKDPMFAGRFDPEDLLDMIREKVPQLTKMEEPLEQIDSRVKELTEIGDTEADGDKIPIGKLPPEDQYAILRNQAIRKLMR